MASTVHLTYICSKDCSWREVDFERPGSYRDYSTVESGGGAFKTGRVTCALVQGPKLTLASDSTKILVEINRGKYKIRPSVIPNLSRTKLIKPDMV